MICWTQSTTPGAVCGGLGGATPVGVLGGVVRALLWAMLAWAVLERGVPVQQSGGVADRETAGTAPRDHRLQRAQTGGSKPGSAEGWGGSSPSRPQVDRRHGGGIDQPRQPEPIGGGDAGGSQPPLASRPEPAPGTPVTAEQGKNQSGLGPDTMPAQPAIAGVPDRTGGHREVRPTGTPNPQGTVPAVTAGPRSHPVASDDSTRQLSPAELDAVMGYVPPDPSSVPQEGEPIGAPE
jgi:hypothetical protein